MYQKQLLEIATLEPINVNYLSDAQPLTVSQLYGLECIFAGTTISGTLSVIVSIGGVVYDEIPGSAQVVTTTGPKSYNLEGQAFPYYKLKWVNSASSANATLTAKSYTK